MEGDLSKLTPGQKSDLMDKVKTQVFVANFQDLLQVSYTWFVVFELKIDLVSCILTENHREMLCEMCSQTRIILGFVREEVSGSLYGPLHGCSKLGGQDLCRSSST